MTYREIIRYLKSLRNEENRRGMARYGINPQNALGIPAPVIHATAKTVGRNHELAEQLWASGIREARLIAALIADPKRTDDEQMERWVRDFDSWDICDGCCSYLFRKTELARRKAFEWTKRDEEFVKRAGFVLIAVLAVHDKKAPDLVFERFLPLLKREARDERNFVKKAINWALRQIGKRNLALNIKAIATAREIQRLDAKSAKWIAADALRELTGEAVQRRLHR